MATVAMIQGCDAWPSVTQTSAFVEDTDLSIRIGLDSKLRGTTKQELSSSATVEAIKLKRVDFVD